MIIKISWILGMWTEIPEMRTYLCEFVEIQTMFAALIHDPTSNIWSTVNTAENRLFIEFGELFAQRIGLKYFMYISVHSQNHIQKLYALVWISGNCVHCTLLNKKGRSMSFETNFEEKIKVQNTFSHRCFGLTNVCLR